MTATAFLGLILIAGSNVPPADELCGRLEAFERQATLQNDRVPHWFEVYWAIDPGAIFSVGCKHQNDLAAKEICSWLPQHMSMEFAGLLPSRISKCHGLNRGRFAATKFPHTTVKFRSRLRNRLVLQTGETADGIPWMRLAVLPAGSKVSVRSLPKPTKYTE